MIRPRRQRGSAYLYVIVCLVVMGILIMHLVPSITQARNTQARRAEKLKADLAADSLVQQVASDAIAAPLVSGASRTLTLNGATVSATIAEGSSTVPNSIALSGTATAALTGNAYRVNRFLTRGILSTPFNFAVASATGFNYNGTFTTGASGADGDVAVNGSLILPGFGATINGDASATGSMVAPLANVTGTRRTGILPVTFPSVSASSYSGAALATYGTTTTTGGIPFPGATAPYAVIYVNGDLTVSGSISNRGCVYVSGNMTVSGNMAYNNATSEVAFIVGGNLTFGSGCAQANGYFYVQGQITNQSSSLTISRGCLAGNAFSGSNGTLKVTRDNFVRTTPAEGYNLALPGYWP